MYSGKVHHLRTLPEYFEAVRDGIKRFEIRKDDRDFEQGDAIILDEWDGKKYTGRHIRIEEIRYILRNCPEYGLMEGYCILGF